MCFCGINVIVINLFGGPSSGKTTMAAGLFRLLKTMNKKVELVQEFAKDLVWENNLGKLSDQFYVTANQNSKLHNLKSHDLDYVVTDSPILLGIAYRPDDYIKSFDNFLLDLYNSYNNFNVLVNRCTKFEEIGRKHNIDESIALDSKIKNILDNNNLMYTSVTGNDEGLEKVYNSLIGH